MKRREFLALLAAVALARPKAAAAQGRQVRIGVLRLWRPKSVSRYAVKAPARAKMRRCSGRISDLPRSIFPGAVRVGGDGEDRDGTIVAIGDQCQRPCTIDRNAGRSEPGLESRDHRRRVSLEVEHRKPVVGNELLRIGRIELHVSADQHDRLVGRNRHVLRRTHHATAP